nr:hypothetical protein HeiferVagina-S102_00081 [Bovine alphaherpesvirus 1]
MRATAPPRPRLLPLLLPLLLPPSLLGLPVGAGPSPSPSPSPEADTGAEAPAGAVFTARVGAPVFLPGPDPRPETRAIRGWSVLASDCPPPEPTPVCLDDRECFADVALDAACLRTARMAPLAIAELTERPDPAGDREFVVPDPRVSARLGRNATGVQIADVTEEDGGVYFLYDRATGDAGDEETQSTLTLRVEPADARDPAGQGEGGEGGEGGRGAAKPTPAPTPSPPRPTPARPAPPPRRRHGARFRVQLYRSHVYTLGDSFTLSVRLQSEFFDEAPFSAGIDWYFLRPAGDCALVRIYETCIFHPEAPACLHPVDARCAFASPYRSETAYSRLYERCRPASADRWPRECEGAAYEAPVAHLRPANNSVDLVFDGAPASASGLYVFVLQYNGHVEAWDYSLVVTSDRLVRAVTDHTRPEAAAADAPEPSPPPADGPADAPGGGARGPAPWLVVLGGALGLAGLIGVAALAVWVCARRAGQKRTYDILNPFGPVYTSLPTNEPLDVVSVSDDEFFPDEDSSFAEDGSDADDELADEPPATAAYDLAGPARGAGGPARPSRSGFKVWFRDPLEDDDVAPARPQTAPDYTVVAARLKSILR